MSNQKEKKEKVFVGNGIEYAQYNLVNISIEMDKASPFIFKHENGKEYLNLTVNKKRERDQFGRTHSVTVNEWKKDQD